MPFPTSRATQFCILHPTLYFLLSFHISNNSTNFPKRISRILSLWDKEIPRDKSSDTNTDEIRVSKTTLEYYPLGCLSVTPNEV